ncbi:hypothetical protein CTAYLR_008068 [Chrysophaeum taylorii]|uniref:Deubiquitinating enzyme MINDY-3/4 conserved domain-containing protein n=1 Tax=Chrysophaeum taylorii TaxID=2483200 RepID=A0AAD7UL63_9STRA|nr:hypothetical protein CTAYLR_008068 [Chrysophaeum taylorii]
MRPPPAQSEMISEREAISLRTLLLGDSSRTQMPAAWKHQGLTFSKDVPFGLLQHDGGPCGVIAVAQAHLVDELLEDKWRSPSPETRARALVRALTRVLWRCCASGIATFCAPTPTPRVDRSPRYAPDGTTECLRLWRADSPQILAEIVEYHLHAWMDPRGPGILCFLYSALLSRTVARARADMDQDKPLVDGHGYAAQEAVNLLTIGRAHSNVFDGTKTLEDNIHGSNDVVELRGIPNRSDLGLLTLHEAYGYYRVGDNLKTPRRPVWIVYSESHYSVLFFGDDPRLVDDRRLPEVFDLIYWDGLGGQDELIRLTIDVEGFHVAGRDPPDPNQALIPPLDLVIRTKWPHASVDWHDTEPIL